MEFTEDRLLSSLYDDEFDDWHDSEYEYDVEGEILFLSKFAEIDRELIPAYLIELEDDCLKRASVYGTQVCSPLE